MSKPTSLCWPLIALSFSIGALQDAKAAPNCVLARETVAYPNGATYNRIHPSGNYVMYTNAQGRCEFVDITNRSKPKTIPTKMEKECYPVEGATGGWDLIAAPILPAGKVHGGMEYYSFDNMINGSGMTESPAYTDSQFGDWYHSSAELPGSTKQQKKVRTLLHQEMQTRDYDFKMTGNKISEANPSDPTTLCPNYFKKSKPPSAEATARADNLQKQVGALESQITHASDGPKKTALEAQVKKLRYDGDSTLYGAEYAKVHAQVLDLEADFKTLGQRLQGEERTRRVGEVTSQLTELRTRLSLLKEGKQMANPVLSKDGTFVAGVVGTQLIVYKIHPDRTCEVAVQFNYRGTKVSFSYPENGKLPKITFTAEGGASGGGRNLAHVYDLNTKVDTVISNEEDDSPTYPGFTKDGRVIFGTAKGYTIVDPSQIAGDKSNCIRAQGSSSSSNSPEPANAFQRGTQ